MTARTCSARMGLKSSRKQLTKWGTWAYVRTMLCLIRFARFWNLDVVLGVIRRHHDLQNFESPGAYARPEAIDGFDA